MRNDSFPSDFLLAEIAYVGSHLRGESQGHTPGWQRNPTEGAKALLGTLL